MAESGHDSIIAFATIPSGKGREETLSSMEVSNSELLLAEAGLHRNPFAPLGAAAGKHFLAALGPHAHAEAMLFAPLAPVGLKCTLGHER